MQSAAVAIKVNKLKYKLMLFCDMRLYGLMDAVITYYPVKQFLRESSNECPLTCLIAYDYSGSCVLCTLYPHTQKLTSPN